MFNLTDAVNEFFGPGSTNCHIALNAFVAPAAATEIVTEFNYKNRRPLSKKHVSVLAEAIKRDDFREYTSIDFAVLNNEPILINGQHTLRAIASAEKPFWLCVHLYKVENEAEVERLYTKYDIGRGHHLLTKNELKKKKKEEDKK